MMDDIHRQVNKGSLYRDSQMGGYHLFVRAGIMLLAVTVFSITTVGITQAEDQPSQAMAVGYQNGAITAIAEKTLDIDGRTYIVTSEAVMVDDHGRMLDPARLVVSAEVKFHVKKEQNNMIEKMIVTLPR